MIQLVKAWLQEDPGQGRMKKYIIYLIVLRNICEHIVYSCEVAVHL